MLTRQLGNSDLALTTVGLGTWAIGGGDWKFGWGPQDESAAIAAIVRAVELGINWVDTAPVYGSGRSEELVGQACTANPAKLASVDRDEVWTDFSAGWRNQRLLETGEPDRGV